MKKTLYILLILLITACNFGKSQNSNNGMIKQTELTNVKLKDYGFLDCMYRDSYFPKFLVDKCKNILVNMCGTIETETPENLEELYKITQSATDKLNDLEDEFFENNSEIETGARECLGANFAYISEAYGFDADVEELIATRNW
ncbi:DUF5713 family protein [Maribacter sp. MJ134]|uniref:DUF5713 family protein n=1 Tax=Maribacter sp. MJ134 TaxID=2496865 RepID=UPI0019D0B945|nr:DUF5713 family protein [Maribacter sp. MJ134]